MSKKSDDRAKNQAKYEALSPEKRAAYDALGLGDLSHTVAARAKRKAKAKAAADRIDEQAKAAAEAELPKTTFAFLRHEPVVAATYAFYLEYPCSGSDDWYVPPNLDYLFGEVSSTWVELTGRAPKEFPYRPPVVGQILLGFRKNVPARRYAAILLGVEPEPEESAEEGAAEVEPA